MSNPNVFTQIEVRTPERATFDLSHNVYMSANFGWLYPCMALDILPGDTVRLSGNMMIRMAPLIAPQYTNIDAFIHYFFVPNRILWPDWEKFITGSNLAGPSTGPTPAHPYVTLNDSNYAAYPLMDYMGLPNPNDPDLPADLEVNAFPFAAYQKIYNDYYRDQNLIAETPWQLDPGSQPTIESQLLTMRKRAWEHDYLTSALPFAQKGPTVDIPLGLIELKPDWFSSTPPEFPQFVPGTGSYTTGDLSSAAPLGIEQINVSGNANAQAYDPKGSLQSSASSINDLRVAFRFQEWLEKNARGGTRYTESLLVHFNVKSSDARLQRAEYISGVKTPIVISEVVNTGGPSGEEPVPQGNLAGHGIAISDENYGSYTAEEHGWIIGILSIRPRTAYQQGVPRMFSRFDRLDYAFPTFANLGEQAILNKEVYVLHPNPNGTFGYTPRYSEYKFMNSRVAGEMKTNLDFWHLGRVFDANPQLNQEFIECDPSYRIFAVETTSVDHFYVKIWHSLEATRPLPYFGTPIF